MEANQINQLLKGNTKTQRDVYDIHADRLMIVVQRYINNSIEAEEVLQDTFVKIFTKIHQFDKAKASFNTWSHKIAINESLMLLRKKRSAKLEYCDLELAKGMIENEALGKMNYENLLTNISQLDNKYRTIVQLRLIEGYEFKEIAVLMGVKESNARRILSRARKQLIEKLKSPNRRINSHYSKKIEL